LDGLNVYIDINKKKAKGVNDMKKILVILLIVVIAGLSTVGAAAIYTTVAATLRPDIAVTLDDQSLSLKDADGDSITPIIVEGSTYRLGNLRQMGPGYFPFLLGLVLAVLGAVVLLFILRLIRGRRTL